MLGGAAPGGGKPGLVRSASKTLSQADVQIWSLLGVMSAAISYLHGRWDLQGFIGFSYLAKAFIMTYKDLYIALKDLQGLARTYSQLSRLSTLSTLRRRATRAAAVVRPPLPRQAAAARQPHPAARRRATAHAQRRVHRLPKDGAAVLAERRPRAVVRLRRRPRASRCDRAR